MGLIEREETKPAAATGKENTKGNGEENRFLRTQYPTQGFYFTDRMTFDPFSIASIIPLR